MKCNASFRLQAPVCDILPSMVPESDARECAPLSLAVKFVCDVKVKLKGFVLLTPGQWGGEGGGGEGGGLFRTSVIKVSIAPQIRKVINFY